MLFWKRSILKKWIFVDNPDLKNYDFEKEPFGKQLFVDNLHAEKVVLEKEY